MVKHFPTCVFSTSCPLSPCLDGEEGRGKHKRAPHPVPLPAKARGEGARNQGSTQSVASATTQFVIAPLWGLVLTVAKDPGRWPGLT